MLSGALPKSICCFFLPKSISFDGDAGCRRGDAGCSSHTECLGWQRSVFTLVYLTVLREMDAAAQCSWLIEDER